MKDSIISEEVLDKFAPDTNKPQVPILVKKRKQNGFLSLSFAGIGLYKMFVVITAVLTVGAGIGSCWANSSPTLSRHKIDSISVTYAEKKVDSLPAEDNYNIKFEPASYKPENYTVTLITDDKVTYTCELSNCRLQNSNQDDYDVITVYSDHLKALKFNYDFESFQKKMSKDNFIGLSEGQIFFVLQYFKDLEVKG